MQGRRDAASGQALELGGRNDHHGVVSVDRDTLGLARTGETHDMAEQRQDRGGQGWLLVLGLARR